MKTEGVSASRLCPIKHIDNVVIWTSVVELPLA